MLKIAEKYPFKNLINLDIENELTLKLKENSFDGIICVGEFDCLTFTVVLYCTVLYLDYEHELYHS